MHIATNRIITEAQLMTMAPSVFATAAHESRSDRYGYVNSIDLIRALVEKGFSITDATQSKARDEGKRDFTKHMVRLRHVESYARVQQAIIEGRAAGDTHTPEARAAARNVRNTYAEVCLVNSHDGSSAVVLHAGLFRLDCYNGLILADSAIASIHVTHSKRLVANVVDAAFELAKQTPKALEAVQNWSGVQLSPQEELAFAEAAHFVRFADAQGEMTTAVRPQQLLKSRRDADVSKDLWTTFNRVQENAVRGGLDDTRPATDAQRERGIFTPRRLRTRAVKSIDGDVKLNKALWMLAEKLAEVKKAA